jgi:hypothetical protein
MGLFSGETLCPGPTAYGASAPPVYLPYNTLRYRHPFVEGPGLFGPGLTVAPPFLQRVSFVLRVTWTGTFVYPPPHSREKGVGRHG